MKNTEELENEILQNPQIIEDIPLNIISAKRELNQLLVDYNISIASIAKKITTSTFIYEVFDNTNPKKPSRNYLIAILIAIECELNTMNRILQLFTYSKIYTKNKFDAIIYYCINNKYDVDKTNYKLMESGFEPLISYK